MPRTARLGTNTSAWRRRAADYLLILLATLAVRLPDLAIPLERDEGEYAYAAQEIQRGHVPYRDTFCQKPPVVFFWYLAGFAAFGETSVGIHLMMTLAATLAAAGLYRTVDHLAKRRAGLAAAIIFAIAAAGPPYFGQSANTEMFMLAPVMWGVYSLLAAAENNRASAWLGSGLLFGLAVLTKQVAVFSVLGPALVVAGRLLPVRGVRAVIRGAFWLAVGTAAAGIPVFLWMFATGAWESFLEATWTHNLAYVGSPYGWWKWRHLAQVFIDRFLFSDGLLWLAMLIGILGLVLRRMRAVAGVSFAAAWFMSSLLGVAAGPYGFGHYFLQALPPLAMMAAVLNWQMLPELLPRWPRLIAGMTTAGILACALAAHVPSFLEPPDQRLFNLYKTYGYPPFVAARDIGLYLRDRTQPFDAVLVIGSEPEILFYSQRRSPTRYVIFYPLTDPLPRAEAMREEMFTQSEQSPPAKVVLCFAPSSLTTDPGSNDLIHQIYDRIERLLRSGYRQEAALWTTTDGRTIWTRPGAPRPPAARCLFHIYGRT